MYDSENTLVPTNEMEKKSLIIKDIADFDNKHNDNTPFYKLTCFFLLILIIMMIFLIQERKYVNTLIELNNEQIVVINKYTRLIELYKKDLEANDLYMHYQSLFDGIDYTDGLSIYEILDQEQCSLILLLAEEITIDTQKILIREDLIAKLQTAYDNTTDEDIKDIILSDISMYQDDIETLMAKRTEAQQTLDDFLADFSEEHDEYTITVDFDDNAILKLSVNTA